MIELLDPESIHVAVAQTGNVSLHMRLVIGTSVLRECEEAAEIMRARPWEPFGPEFF